MLALVKKPRIEISLQGENIDELLNWIKKKYEIAVLASRMIRKMTIFPLAVPNMGRI